MIYKSRELGHAHNFISIDRNRFVFTRTIFKYQVYLYFIQCLGSISALECLNKKILEKIFFKQRRWNCEFSLFKHAPPRVTVFPVLKYSYCVQAIFAMP